MNKVTRFISAVSALMAISVSCAKQELPVSTFKMDSTAIVVPAGGGICSVPYQVASSDAGETVEAVSPQNWVNGFDYSVDGVIHRRQEYHNHSALWQPDHFSACEPI